MHRCLFLSFELIPLNYWKTLASTDIWYMLNQGKVAFKLNKTIGQVSIAGLAIINNDQ